MEERRAEELAALPAEELEKRLREAFFYTDRIDDTVFRELEALRQALEARRPQEHDRTPEESWAQFREDHAEELAEFCRRERRRRAARKTGRVRAAVRLALLAAAVLALLAGTVLAVEPLGLRAWTARWDPAAGRYAPVSSEAAGKPIPAALRELGITETVYPARLPDGFVLTGSHISEDPLILMEQYAKGDRVFTVTVASVKGVQSAVYQSAGGAYREYGAGSSVHYLFRNEGTITAVWYTGQYATSVSGNLSLEEVTRIIESLSALPEGGYAP